MDTGKIREIRRELDWSQFKLEQESGVSRNKIALHEQGYRALSEKELRQVCLVLKGELERVSGADHHDTKGENRGN